MDDNLKIYLATIWGEAASSSLAAQLAVGSVILNRIGEREWRRMRTPSEVIAGSGFDAFKFQNAPYRAAWKLLERPDDIDQGSKLGVLMAAVLPIYGGREKPTTDAVLYFSPLAQGSLHARNPSRWPKVPAWRFELLEEVKVPGTEGDDFSWWRYRV